MLRNVLEDYLSSINEREFDYPLSALLQAMGFYDIHFTHGGVEFGKDFIAKRVEDGIEHQYAIQSKKGDINQSLWRNEIRGQLEEAILSDLSHPQFNTGLPRKVVLATTGRLSGNARLASQEFKARLEENNQIHELIFWEKEQLAQFSEEYGFMGIYPNAVKELKGLAQFYLTFSKALEETLSDREIEDHSRLWLDESLDNRKRILRAAIEAEIIAVRLTEGKHLYEAIITYLAFARVILEETYKTDDPFLIDIYNETLEGRILPLCKLFFDGMKSDWEEVGESLLNLCRRDNVMPMLQYIVGVHEYWKCSLYIFF